MRMNILANTQRNLILYCYKKYFLFRPLFVDKEFVREYGSCYTHAQVDKDTFLVSRVSFFFEGINIPIIYTFSVASLSKISISRGFFFECNT